ncbi:MAG: class I SAM-dependent methyltransferase [Anaerolineales bacterium]|nr:class I SAM-dependent methyltransferase [Anaerolineales bacterium]
METIRGKTCILMDLNELHDRLANYNRIILDLGTGDGRYVHSLAERFPADFIIGVDSCRENLHEYSRAKLLNMLFIISNAQSLPCELNGLVSHISINFPWGSLLDGLLTADTSLMRGLERLATSTASIDVHLNGGALADAGWPLENGADKIYYNLLQAGWRVRTPRCMDEDELQVFPTTWARRLAHGRDPRGMKIHS